MDSGSLHVDVSSSSSLGVSRVRGGRRGAGLAGESGRARAGALRFFALFRPELAHARPVPWWPRRRGERRAGPAQRVLLRRGERRRVEDHRRRARVDAHIRFPTCRLHRRACSRPFGTRHDLRGNRRVHPARFDELRQRHVQVHGRRQDVDAHRARRHAAHRQNRGRSRGTPNLVFVAVIGHLYEAHPDRGVFRSQDGGKTWKKVLFKNDSVGAADVAIDPTNPRIVYASLWNTRRPTWYTYQPTNGPGGGLFKSTDGGTTWNQLTNGLPTTCVGKTGIAIAPSNPRRLYAVVDDFLPEGAAADTPCPGAPPGRGAGAGSRWRSRRRPWTRRWRRRGRSRSGSRAAGRLLPIGRRRRDMDEAVRRHRPVGSWLVFRARRRRSEKRGHRVRAERGAVAIEGRRQDVGAAARLPGGDDYQQPWIAPDDPEHPDLRERSGDGDHAQRHGRRSTRRDLELVAESADRADLSPLRGRTVSVLGHRRSAGQRCCRGALAREVREHHDAGLGTDRRRGRERHDSRRSAAPRHHLRRCRHALRPRNQSAAADDSAGQPGAGPNGLDGAAGVLEGRSARALLREPVPLQDDGRRADVDSDQSGPDAPRSRHPRQPRRGRRTRHRSQRYARRDLHRRPFAAQRADGVDRDRRRRDPGDDERREGVAERDAGGADVVEPHHDDRGVTQRRERGIRIGRSSSARRLHPAHLSHARPRKDVAGDHARPAGAEATSTSSRRIRPGAGCCSPVPSARRSCRSTMGTTGSRCS